MHLALTYVEAFLTISIPDLSVSFNRAVGMAAKCEFTVLSALSHLNLPGGNASKSL